MMGGLWARKKLLTLSWRFLWSLVLVSWCGAPSWIIIIPEKHGGKTSFFINQVGFLKLLKCDNYGWYHQLMTGLKLRNIRPRWRDIIFRFSQGGTTQTLESLEVWPSEVATICKVCFSRFSRASHNFTGWEQASQNLLLDNPKYIARYNSLK